MAAPIYPMDDETALARYAKLNMALTTMPCPLRQPPSRAFGSRLFDMLCGASLAILFLAILMSYRH